MAKRKPRPLHPPRIELRGRRAETRVIDRDFAGVDLSGVTSCVLDWQHEITKVPPFGPALRELELFDCSNLASLDGIEKCTGLTRLRLGRPSQRLSLLAEIDRLAELPELSTLVLEYVAAPVPRALAKLPGLIELRLENCAPDIAKLAQVIVRSPTIRRLALEEHDSWELADELAPMNQLRALELASCAALPPSIGALVELERFAIVKGAMKRLPPEIGKLAALVELDVEAPITRLPDELCACGALEVLHVRSSHLTRLPEAIGKLACLRVLDLRTVPLGSLPESFGELAALRDLKLPVHTALLDPPGVVERLALETFVGPEEIGMKIPMRPPPTPHEDDVRIDDPARIPDDFGDPVTLELVLPGYRGAFPQLAQLRRLVDLTLHVGDPGPALAALAHAPHLAKLVLVVDDDAAVPDSIGALVQLAHLELYAVGSIPEAIDAMAALRTLRVSSQRVTSLPASLADLQLERVDLYNTSLTTFPDALALSTTIEHLTLSSWAKDLDLRALGGMRALRGLEIDFVPRDLAAVLTALAATPLASLDFANAPLAALPSTIGKLADLEVLMLRRTPLTRLPSALKECTKLRYVELPCPEFDARAKDQLPPGTWSKHAWSDFIRFERR